MKLIERLKESTAKKEKSRQNCIWRRAKKTALGIIVEAEKKLNVYLWEDKKLFNNTKKSFNTMYIHCFYHYESKDYNDKMVFSIIEKYFRKENFSIFLKQKIADEGDHILGIKPSYNHEVWLSW